MTQATTLMENDALVRAVDASVSTKKMPLRAAVREFLQQHLLPFERPKSVQLYDQVLVEMEIPLLEMVLQYCNQNQSRAAKLLNISRGNLRQKMKRYQLLSKEDKL
jgi:Fis family transcriptional regulator, factor for inversion stimulation protein